MNFLIRIGLVLGLGFNLGFCEELMVSSWPVIDATLYINGKRVGETPFNITIEEGTYTLKAEKEGWRGEEKEIVVKKGDNVFANIFMQRIEPEKEVEKIEKIVPKPIEVMPKTIEIAKIPKISMLIIKASSKIEEAEEAGAQRYAKERLKNAKRLLYEAKRGNSFSLAEAAYKEAEFALKETREKIAHYSSSYIMGIIKHIGK